LAAPLGGENDRWGDSILLSPHHFYSVTDQAANDVRFMLVDMNTMTGRKPIYEAFYR
jgi:hypothetical protein